MTFLKLSEQILQYIFTKKILISLLIFSQVLSFNSKGYASPINNISYKISLAQNQQRTIAVADFTNDTGDPAMDYLKKGLANSLVTSLGVNANSNFSIVERGQFEALTKEMGLASTGVVDVSTATKIGNALGATEVIVGGIIKLGNTLRLNIRVIDVKTSKLQFAFTEYTNSEGDVLKLLDKIAYQIVNSLSPVNVTEQPNVITVKPELKTSDSKLEIKVNPEKNTSEEIKKEEGIPQWVWITGGIVVAGVLVFVIISATRTSSNIYYGNPSSSYPVYDQNQNTVIKF